jgi:hypothetical protein
MPLPQHLAMGLSNLSMHFYQTFFFFLFFIASMIAFLFTLYF